MYKVNSEYCTYNKSLIASATSKGAEDFTEIAEKTEELDKNIEISLKCSMEAKLYSDEVAELVSVLKV